MLWLHFEGNHISRVASLLFQNMQATNGSSESNRISIFFLISLHMCVHVFVYVVWVISHTHCYKDSNESRTFLYKCVACVSLSKQKLLELFQFKRKQFLFRLLYAIAIRAFSLFTLPPLPLFPSSLFVLILFGSFHFLAESYNKNWNMR